MPLIANELSTLKSKYLAVILKEMKKKNMDEETINNLLDECKSALNISFFYFLNYIDILSAKINSQYQFYDVSLLAFHADLDIPNRVDTRWIRNLHKLKIAIDVVKSNIPENIEQSSSTPIDMKKLLSNSIDNLNIFCDSYLNGTIAECLTISMQDITTTTQSADIAFQLISSIDDKKTVALATNMYLMYRETLDLIPDDIVVSEHINTQALVNPIENSMIEKVEPEIVE